MEFKFTEYAKIRKPVAEVFDAVVNPAKLKQYFTTGGANAPLVEGTTVTWDFADFPGAFPVHVRKVVPNRAIVLEWQAADGKYDTRVEMSFEALDSESAKVQIGSPDTLQIMAGKDDGLVFAIPAYKMTADVKFDGKDYAVSGPTVPAGFTMGLRRIDARSFEMIQKVGGKVVYRDTMTLSADGKTLTDVGVAEGTQEKIKAVYDRQ